MKRSSAFGAALAVLLLAVLAVPAIASAVTSGAVLDQSNAATNCDIGVSSSQASAQTFTAGITGSLTDVVLTIGNSSADGPLHVSITNVTAGAPDNSSVLATSDVATTDESGGGPTDYDVAFATPAHVVAGTTYGITATSTGAGWWLWYCANGDSYAAGDSYWDSGGGWNTFGNDVGFETYVLVPAAPSPSVTSRMGYCSAAGDTWASGAAIPVGTFLNLAGGQPDSDPHFGGATPANYVQGEGITCDQPPAGWVQQGWAGWAGATLGPGAVYRFFAPAA